MTHFLGYVLSPGDPIEVSHRALGVSKMPALVQRLAESGERQFKVTAVEHPITLEAIKRGRRNGAPTVPTDGPKHDYNCITAECPIGGADATVINWFGGGLAFAPGQYRIEYVGGAYRPTEDGTWVDAVAGFDVVGFSTDSTTPAVIVPCPAVSVLAPGFADAEAAEIANEGENATFTLTAASPLGLRVAAGGNAYDSLDAATAPLYRICPLTGEPPVDPPVGPTTCPPDHTTLSTSYSVSFHQKVRSSGMCDPDCEGNATVTLTDLNVHVNPPASWSWNAPAGGYELCTANFDDGMGGTTPYTFGAGADGGPVFQITLNYRTAGDGTCYWEITFSDGTCHSIFRKYTGDDPKGSYTWFNEYPGSSDPCDPSNPANDGTTHRTCTAAGHYDSVTSVVVS